MESIRAKITALRTVPVTAGDQSTQAFMSGPAGMFTLLIVPMLPTTTCRHLATALVNAVRTGNEALPTKRTSTLNAESVTVVVNVVDLLGSAELVAMSVCELSVPRRQLPTKAVPVAGSDATVPPVTVPEFGPGVNVTGTLPTGFPKASTTRTPGGVEMLMLATPAWLSPTNLTRSTAGPASAFTLNAAGCAPVAVAVTIC